MTRFFKAFDMTAPVEQQYKMIDCIKLLPLAQFQYEDRPKVLEGRFQCAITGWWIYIKGSLDSLWFEDYLNLISQDYPICSQLSFMETIDFLEKTVEKKKYRERKGQIQWIIEENKLVRVKKYTKESQKANTETIYE